MVVNEAPDDYILPAILSCIFCCIPLGIGAIVAACLSTEAEIKVFIINTGSKLLLVDY
jgi:hypothetical protein